MIVTQIALRDVALRHGERESGVRCLEQVTEQLAGSGDATWLGVAFTLLGRPLADSVVSGGGRAARRRGRRRTATRRRCSRTGAICSAETRLPPRAPTLRNVA